MINNSIQILKDNSINKGDRIAYKGKNSIFTFNIFSSYCIPFIYFVAIDSQNFQRCSGLLSVFILLFAYDLIISLLNEFLKVKPKPIIK